jgi:hypothetical protein
MGGREIKGYGKIFFWGAGGFSSRHLRVPSAFAASPPARGYGGARCGWRSAARAMGVIVAPLVVLKVL